MDTRKYLTKILPHYVHHRNLVNKGNGEFTFLRHPIQMGLLFAIAYKNVPIWCVVGLVIAYLFGCWFYGWGWDKLKGYDIEREWSNERNPTLQTIKSSTSTKPTLTKRKA